jgi:hypothetical protein
LLISGEIDGDGKAEKFYDTDGDGKIDVVAYGNGTQDTVRFTGKGNTIPTADVNKYTTSKGSQFTTLDFDRDGKPDAVSGGY